MIDSTTVKIKYVKDFDNAYIESELSKVYTDIIRWAIVDVKTDTIVVSISYGE